jgi:hypothetical protein
VRQQSVPIHGQQLTQPISITGNVLAAVTAPNAILYMTYIDDAQSNLRINWSWSTASHAYGGDVPANYLVGLFIYKTGSVREWHAFRVDSTPSPQATWAQRVQRFHDAYANGGIRDPAPKVFGAGEWCVVMAAASTRENGGTFLPAPGAAGSCVDVPGRNTSGRSSHPHSTSAPGRNKAKVETIDFESIPEGTVIAAGSPFPVGSMTILTSRNGTMFTTYSFPPYLLGTVLHLRTGKSQEARFDFSQGLSEIRFDLYDGMIMTMPFSTYDEAGALIERKTVSTGHPQSVIMHAKDPRHPIKSLVTIQQNDAGPLLDNFALTWAPAGPLAVVSLGHIQSDQSNLGVSWSWSTSSDDYDGEKVPANYVVGLFVRNAAENKWHPFKVDAAPTAEATWSERIQRVRDAYPGGGIREPAGRVFESGEWCVVMASASKAETGAIFTIAPNSLPSQSCVTITAESEAHHPTPGRGNKTKP